jgi:hypothetical protein
VNGKIALEEHFNLPEFNVPQYVNPEIMREISRRGSAGPRTPREPDGGASRKPTPRRDRAMYLTCVTAPSSRIPSERQLPLMSGGPYGIVLQ